MSTVFGTSLSGLNRALLGVQAVSSNIANVNTPGYRAVRFDAGSGAVRYRSDTFNTSAQLDASTPSDVNLVAELADLKRHEHAFRANATLIDFEDQRLGELLDILA